MEMVTLYHGTGVDEAESIKESGLINGPAYFTPSREVAEHYATYGGSEDGVVIEIEVPIHCLHVDMECLNEDPGVEHAVNNGMAVFSKIPVECVSAKFTLVQ